MKIGIRKETQYPSEKRAALTPDHVIEIVKNGIDVLIEPAENQRIFTQSFTQSFSGPATRAKATQPTLDAPARDSERAQALNVAPVVITSSTKMICLPLTAVLLRTLKAPRTFLNRPLRPKAP